MKLRWVSFLFVLSFISGLTSIIQGAEPEVRERLPLGSVTAQGWLREQLLRSKDGMGGNLDLLEPEMIGKPYTTRDFQSKVSPGWSGEISGTYWTGLVQLAFTLNDSELIAKADRWVHECIALQEPDGYLGSYRSTDNRMEDYSAWSANWCYRALLAWYDATGEEAVLDAVHRSLVWYTEQWSGEKKTTYAGPTLMESMIDVWLLTGDKRLADWCVDYLAWLDQHDEFYHGKSSLERPELQFNEDHTVAFAENVKHPALVYLYNGDSTFLAASENGIRQDLDKAWQCTGGPASNFEYHSPPSSVHETEYCAWSTWLNTFSRMLCITDQSRYGDLMEFTLFNGAQGARLKDELAITYNSSPNQFFATMKSSPYNANPSYGVYAPCYNVACCPAQSVRIYPEYIRVMFLRDKEGNIELPAYGPVTASFNDGPTNVTIDEKTLYPFDETITLHITTSEPWTKTLRLKKPNWCEEYKIELDGKSVELDDVNGWFVFNNEWQDNELKITFTMSPKVIPAKDVYFQSNPLMTVLCGPLLFANKLKEKIVAHPGHPITPLPEGWSWFDITCEGVPDLYSIDTTAIESPKVITKKITESAYPWDDSPIKLVVPMIRCTEHGWPRNTNGDINWWVHSRLPYGNPVTPDNNATVHPVELVPFGCTVMRQACFTTVQPKKAD